MTLLFWSPKTQGSSPCRLRRRWWPWRAMTAGETFEMDRRGCGPSIGDGQAHGWGSSIKSQILLQLERSRENGKWNHTKVTQWQEYWKQNYNKRTLIYICTCLCKNKCRTYICCIIFLSITLSVISMQVTQHIRFSHEYTCFIYFIVT